jgi:hypothetical protein
MAVRRFGASVDADELPRTPAELADQIEALTALDYATGGDTYQQSADAIWEATLVTFKYVAAKVGATTFQESWSALRFYSEARHILGPFMVVKIEDALYPERNLPATVASFVEEHRPWLAGRATEMLNEQREGLASPAHTDAIAHWQWLIDQAAVRPNHDEENTCTPH